jgi:ABC-type glycerol-3-phosphate transport system substrate-binding protein
MKYMMEPDTQIEIVLSGAGRPAARKAVLDNAKLMEQLVGHRVTRPTFDTAEGWLEPDNLRIEEARAVLDQLSGAIAAKQQTVDQRITEIEQKLQQVLDKPRAQ